jgi:predicted ATPase/DNA-binding CsgD family transcriptional regulator
VAEVRRLLSESRMVTLTGVGGVGKTRLASRVGAELQRAFPDGVWLIELSEVRSPDQLLQTIAEALELPTETSPPTLGTLVDHLRCKWALLILDNCEHLLDDCAMVAETLLRSGPDLRILATSRQALGIASEHLLSVPPLWPQESDGYPLPEPVAPNEAVQLFTQRARAVLPGFAVTEMNRPAVEAVCRQLDGVPLELELAASRLRALSAEQLLDRLGDRFRLLTSGSPVVPPRHRTLRALIDWSHDLCTEQERLLWARASVFSGGLDLDAVEAICSGDGIAREEIIELVSGLVAKSVLIREEYSSGARYRLLGSIRAYGQELLAATGEQEAVRARHHDYYRRLSAEAHAQLFNAPQVPMLIRLRLEHANLRTVLEQSFADPAEITTGLRMATDLLYHWIADSRFSEGRRWLDRGLAVHTEPDELRARALLAGSRLAFIQGDIGSAATMVKECRVLGERLENESVLGYADVYSGMITMRRGDPGSAVPLYETAVARHRATGNPSGMVLALVQLSLAHSILGDTARAISIIEDGLAICDLRDEGWHRAYTTAALGIAAWRHGDTGRAAELERESLRFHRSLGNRLGIGLNLEVLAWIAATEGRHERAAQLLGSTRALEEATGAFVGGFGHLASYRDECESRIRAALGEPAYRTAFERGTGLACEIALGHALGDRAPAERPPEAPKTPKAPSPLTRRETEIARLVAKGLSNKEIAASLTIAQRTAEGHIEHILNKLGFNSRTQIAIWVGEQNLGPDGPDEPGART